MKEFEFQFIDIDISDFKNKLEEVGAESIHDEITYKSSYFYMNECCDTSVSANENSFIRVRLEGNIVTLTMKKIGEGFADEMEYFSNVKSDILYNETVAFYSMSYKNKVVTEKKSEKWKYDDIIINIDTWPGLPSYIEVEGPATKDIFEFMKELGYTGEYKYFKHGAFDYYVHKYGIKREILRKSSLTFDTIDEFLRKYKS